MSDFIEVVDSIELETTDDCLMSYPSKLMVYNDKIYVMDNLAVQNIFLFDLNGNFIAKAGSIGNGPGEYAYLEDFTIDRKNEQLLLLVNGGWRVVCKDLTGKYINSYELGEYYSYLFSMENGFMLGCPVSASHNNFLLSRVDDSFHTVQNCLKIPSEYQHLVRRNLIGYTGYQSNYLFVPVLSPVIYQVNEDGCKPEYEFVLDSQHVLTPEKLSSYKTVQPTQTHVNTMVNETMNFFNLTSYFDVEDYLFATFELDGNKYWCIYHPASNTVKYVNLKNMKNDLGIDAKNIYFISQLDENRFVGFVVDEARETEGLNPMIVVCRLKKTIN